MTGIKAPSMSAVGVAPSDADPLQVLAWVFTFSDRTMVLADNGDFLGRFDSEDSAVRFMSFGIDSERLRLSVRALDIIEAHK
ncbi:MAG: hypothetical protein ABIQ18_39680 [Umezawaea sp.]